jgi:hypothetical protein
MAIKAYWQGTGIYELKGSQKHFVVVHRDNYYKKNYEQKNSKLMIRPI